MRTGRIIRGVGGFYDVVTNEGETVTCKARGRFRNERTTPMVGDLVSIKRQDSGYAAIDEILPRRNALIRPPVANIDQIVIVVSASAPAPDWLLVDKLIVQAKLAHVDPIPVLNKCDETDESILRTFSEEYARWFDTLVVSAHTRQGLEQLSERLSNKTTCLAGQSAVGKSSMLNALIPELQLAIGELSEKTARGRHTTRMARLWPYRGGAVLDTPGFSLFELEDLPQEKLNQCYPEFAYAAQDCRFAQCSHRSEPSCAVKSLLSDGGLSKGRYDRYLLIASEIEQRRKHRYD